MRVRIGSMVIKGIVLLNQLNLELSEDAAPQGKSPMRRCIVTGEINPRENLLRFVASPEGLVVFDIKANLPGRGMWMVGTQENLETAIAKNLFMRAAKQKVQLSDNLAQQVQLSLFTRMLNLIQRAHSSRDMVNGFEKCTSAVQAGEVRMLIHANDAKEDGMRKLNNMAEESVVVIQPCSREELSNLLSIPNPVHLAVKSATLAKAIRNSYQVWARFLNKDRL